MVHFTLLVAPFVAFEAFTEAFSISRHLHRRDLRWSRGRTHYLPIPGRRLCAESAYQESSEEDPLNELSEERQASLFQFLLRDLQVEGVPLLGCDANQAHTVQAAIWTSMAEISEKDGEEKACLVFEDLPVDVLRTFIDDFLLLKTDLRLMKHLPELERISVSLVGKGVGPAVLIESAERGDGEKTADSSAMQDSMTQDYNKFTAAMKTFVDRMVVGLEVCPYTKNNNEAPTGLEDRGISTGPIAYRLASSTDACDVLSGFWTCICELLSLSDEDLSTTIFSLPRAEGHDRFTSMSELISRSLFLYRGEDVFELLHMHPEYDRNLIYPSDKPAHGHLPPTSWLRSMLQFNGNNGEAETLTDEDLDIQNFQRRSPLPAVIIKRVSQLDAATNPESGIVEIQLEDGQIEKASGVPTYCSNLIRLVDKGKDALQTESDAEIAITA